MLVPASTFIVRLALAVPSLAVSVSVALPFLPKTGATVSVRFFPLPPIVIAFTGSKVVLDDVTFTDALALLVVNVTMPEKLVKHAPPGPTAMVSDGAGVLVAVLVLVGAMVAVLVLLGTFVTVAVALGVAVSVGTAVSVVVLVAVFVRVCVAAVVGVSVTVAVSVGVLVDVLLAVGVLVAVGIAVDVLLAVGESVGVLLAVGELVAVLVAVAVGTTIVQVKLAGVASTLPALSLAKTRNVC